MRAFVVYFSLSILAWCGSACAQSREQVSSIRGVRLGMNRDDARVVMSSIFSGTLLQSRTFDVDAVPYEAISARGKDFETEISMTVLLSPKHRVVVGVCYTERYTRYSARDSATIAKALSEKFGRPSEQQLSGEFTWWRAEDGRPVSDGCNNPPWYHVAPDRVSCNFRYRHEGTESCPIEAEASFPTSKPVEEWQLKIWHHHLFLTELKSYLEERERRRTTPPRL